MQRNLSGIFFRERVNDKWENICFEECSKEKQDEILDKADPKFVKNLAKQLGGTILELGNKFDIYKE